ncbi:MAG: hypothetical protein HY270_01330 [Deltaproteobacteria bacterium]|nr:hypothetical protein [Deltaproteobacteria bacterium]
MTSQGRRNLKLLAFLAIVFLSLEGSLRIAFSSPTFLKRYVRGGGSDAMRLLWVNRHRGQEVTAYRFDVHDPRRGWAVRPAVPRSRAFGNRWLSTNSRGLRGMHEFEYEKTPGRLRIATIGDSFTFGDQVSDDQTYAALLGRQLADAEVLNFGVHGYGHDQMLLYLQSDVIKYHPDVVILGFVAADMSRNLLAFRDFAKPYFDLLNGALELRNVPVPTPEEVLHAEVYRLKTVDAYEIFRERLSQGARPQQTYVRQLTSAILDEIVRTIQSNGARPLFVYLPVPREVHNPRRRGPTWGEAFFSKYCEAHNIACVSLRPLFADRAADPSVAKTLFRWGHWSEVGHGLAAPALADDLVTRGWARKPE